MLNELSIIVLLVFGAILFGVHGMYGPLSRSRQSVKSTKRRLAESIDRTARHGTIDALRSHRGIGDFDNPALRRINDLVTQTGLQLTGATLAIAGLALGGTFFAACSLVFGPGWISALLTIALTPIAAFALLHILREKRRARFAELLPDTIDVMVRAIRVGYPLPAALSLVAREIPDPVGPEFAFTAEEISFGQDVRTAVQNLHQRVGLDDLIFLVVAINVQTQTGGNLAEILARLSRLLRNRTKLQLKIRALSADGRMSALVLSLMPFVLFAGISLIAPSYFAEARHSLVFLPALIYGALSLLIGNVVMYRMVNFRF
ncbi:MAG TPA: type II secretion system F family protein [Pseudolabrys sp.]|nr:type II secretion system F family protein [Pseudolabrys sp.]